MNPILFMPTLIEWSGKTLFPRFFYTEKTAFQNNTIGLLSTKESLKFN